MSYMPATNARSPSTPFGFRGSAAMLLAGILVAGCSNKATQDQIVEEPMVEESAALRIERAEAAPTYHDPQIGRSYRLDDAGNKIYLD